MESLDKICHGCGLRNRATIWRKPGRRGRHQKTIVMGRPSYMPLHARDQEAKRRNAAMGRPRSIGFQRVPGGGPEGFTRASELEEFRVRKDE